MLSEGRLLTERDVRLALGGAARGARLSAPLPATLPEPGGEGASTPERDAIEQALQRVGGNRAAAARDLGISRRSLYRRLDALGLR